MTDQVEFATFGAGCFWGVEARFRELKGVLDATSGYMGGGIPAGLSKRVHGNDRTCRGGAGEV